MKKKCILVVLVVLVLVIALALVACGEKKADEIKVRERTPSQSTDTTSQTSGDHMTTTVKLNNGIYEGEILTSSAKSTPIFDGQGKLTDNAGNVYEGHWSNGKKDGQGKQTYANGDVYEGEWANNVFEGMGKYTWKNGDYYSGRWRSGSRFGGNGTYYFATGEVETYVGGTAGDALTGDCVITYRNGSVYEGHAENGKRSGQGTMRYADTSVYTGMWSNDKEDGQGRFQYVGGDVFEGLFVAGSIGATGKYTWASGDVYEGAFYEGLPHGNGTKYFVVKDEEGNVLADAEGKAQYETFTGSFSRGEMGSSGTYTWPNGDVYEGSFMDGVQQGEGKMYYAVTDANGNARLGTDGKPLYDVFEGQFANGVIGVSGKFTWSDGDVYEGAFVNGLPEGQGVKTFVKSNGNDVFRGLFVAGEIGARGEYIWANTESYKGEFDVGKPNGEGKMYMLALDSQGNVQVDGQGNTLYDIFEGHFVAGVISGTGTLAWASGNSFAGTFADGKIADGVVGTYTWKNGTVYTGTFLSELMDEGTIVWDDHNSFTGTFVNDKPSHGRFVYADAGEMFDGTFVNDKKQGVGTLYCYNETSTQYDIVVYEGNWVADQKSGAGKYYAYAEGTNTLLYDGNWEADKKDGLGTYYMADGRTFKGVFVADAMVSGQYTYTNNGDRFLYEGDFPSGTRTGVGSWYRYNQTTEKYDELLYEGGWLDNQFQGHGVRYYDEGARYDGEWQNSLRVGEGTFYYAGGDVYRGQWAGDQKTHGVYVDSETHNEYEGDFINGETRTDADAVIRICVGGEAGQYVYDVYTGAVENGVQQGAGILVYHDGHVYDGNWAAGKKSGAGKYSMGREGEQNYALIYDGNWSADKKDGKGVGYNDDGSVYDGEWVADQMQGAGIYYYKDGKVYVGEWVANQKSGAGVMAERTTGTETYAIVYSVDWTDEAYAGIYRGNWSADKRHGQGKGYLGEGEWFNGEWDQDSKVSGLYHYANGDEYEGAFDAQGKKTGKATFAFNDGRAFDGWYVNDNMDHGELTYTEGGKNYLYDGYFADGVFEGAGKQYAMDGGKTLLYDGAWSGGQFNGAGTYYAGAERYVGNFAAGNRDGAGIYYYEDGKVYVGLWVANQKSGNGILAERTTGPETYAIVYSADWTDANYADIYRGNWSADKKNGKGVYYFTADAKQYRYDGDFEADKRQGSGELCENVEGDYVVVFNGSWTDNDMSSGTYYYTAEGKQYRYVGAFVDGKPQSTVAYLYEKIAGEYQLMFTGSFDAGAIKDGTGKRLYASGDVYEGAFVDGKISNGTLVYTISGVEYTYVGAFDTNEEKSGLGTLTYTEDDKVYRYEGEFEADKRNGQGTLYVDDVKEFSGNWIDDEPQL